MSLEFKPHFKVPPSFASFVADEAFRLQKAFGFASISDVIRTEEDFWKNASAMQPDVILKLYQEERLRAQMLTELIWAVVKKSGGEVRLSIEDLVPSDWHLKETYDMETKQKIFKADTLT